MNAVVKPGRGSAPLVPPKHHFYRAGHHWVQKIDYDGRGLGLEVYQWQPASQKWCRPNEYACGLDRELVDYVWVAPCHMPLFPDEVEGVKAVLEDLTLRMTSGNEIPVTRATITAEQLATIRNFVTPYTKDTL